jgi:hypothetical protein
LGDALFVPFGVWKVVGGMGGALEGGTLIVDLGVN